jgi:hypothetical protein
MYPPLSLDIRRLLITEAANLIPFRRRWKRDGEDFFFTAELQPIAGQLQLAPLFRQGLIVPQWQSIIATDTANDHFASHLHRYTGHARRNKVLVQKYLDFSQASYKYSDSLGKM